MIHVHISDASAGKSTPGKEMVSKTTVWRIKEERLEGSFKRPSRDLEQRGKGWERT